jgi:hypothetical protein
MKNYTTKIFWERAQKCEMHLSRLQRTSKRGSGSHCGPQEPTLNKLFFGGQNMSYFRQTNLTLHFHQHWWHICWDSCCFELYEDQNKFHFVSILLSPVSIFRTAALQSFLNHKQFTSLCSLWLHHQRLLWTSHMIHTTFGFSVTEGCWYTHQCWVQSVKCNLC